LTTNQPDSQILHDVYHDDDDDEDSDISESWGEHLSFNEQAF
jgi:hypothetical protein